MNIPTLHHYLEDAYAAAVWLCGLGVVDVRKAHDNLRAMARAGVTLDLLAVMCDQLGQHLASCADPDMALHNLERFVRAGRNPLAVGTLFERDPQTMPTVLQIFTTSQYLSDLLVNDSEGLDLLRLTEGEPVPRQALVDEMTAEINVLDHDSLVLRALRRFKRRETLRIAYGDIVREQSLRTVTAQISFLADALLEGALRAAWRKVERQRGTPRVADGRRARFVILGLGKLGGLELNYSSDIDLIFFCENDGRTDGPRPISNTEFFELVARELIRSLTERTELGAVYRVDMRLRPDGQRGPMVMGVDHALAYYDTRGRTWERQAYIKARPVAGDLSLGDEFLAEMTPWIYRRYLSHTDISGIKALKRRIEQQTTSIGGGARDVKTGRGGIRDIEFVIQFLQLLNGGDLAELRTGNTLEALLQLERVGCLTNLERSILEDNYTFLRKIEHRLQVMLDLQTHLLPDNRDELRKLALRMGYATTFEQSALENFLGDFRARTDLNRKILDHLLHDAFSDDRQTQAEVDLVLDPEPSEERIEEVLGKYRFRDVGQAYRNLMSLSEERVAFLSTRRCRQFLAAIAPQLLGAIAATADPDATLVALDKVSSSLGGKGVLWELFSFNPPSLELYVRLCAYSPYLSGILVSNPGMIDSLMDSLVLDKLPTQENLSATLRQLCGPAEDIDPILYSFKNDQELCVGVRDILGKEDLQATTGALSDIAQACLGEITRRQYRRLVARYGVPRIANGPRMGETCELVILALGKFGGREMNFRSDLDLVFLYEADGATFADGTTGSRESTSNRHFFSELAQRIISTTSRLSGYGRLYEIDARLRPTGRSGALAISFDEFVRYFHGGGGQLWERQSLCKARVVYGAKKAAKTAEAAIAEAAFDHPWQPSDAAEIRQMRYRLEEAAAGAGDLKRGHGGIADIEFLVQMFQLKHAREKKRLRVSNTLVALKELQDAGLLSADDYAFFDANYRLLRTIEGRLRLMSPTARNTLPQESSEMTKIARLLRYPHAQALLSDYEQATRETRRRFERIFADEARAG